MRIATAVACAVLALAMLAWWALHDRPQVGIVSPDARDGSIVDRPLNLASATGSTTEQGPSGWVQTEADRAWCLLPDVPKLTDTASTSQAELQAYQQAVISNEANKQSEAEMQRLRALWSARLRAKGDDQSLAAALLLEGKRSSRQELATLALRTRDPVVYAWAYGACAKPEDCGLSALRWAQLDPGNARPWLLEADRAGVAGQPQAQREALYQVGLAQRNEGYLNNLRLMVLGLGEARAPGRQMAAEVMNSMSLPVFFAQGEGTLEYCAAAQADASRQPVCQAAADSIWRSASEMTDAQFALILAQGAGGWSPSLLAKRKTEIEQSEAAGRAWLAKMSAQRGADSQHCNEQPEARRFLMEVFSVGDLAFYRKLRNADPPLPVAQD